MNYFDNIGVDTEETPFWQILLSLGRVVIATESN